MAQNREKEETLDLKLQPDSPLSLSSHKISMKRPGSDLSRIDPTRRPRFELLPETSDPPQRSSCDQEVSATSTVKKSVNRCSGCAKRVGLMGFRCRCGDLFCPEHRYSDRHDCSYDYKSAGREVIARENPVVRAAKILKV